MSIIELFRRAETELVNNSTVSSTASSTLLSSSSLLSSTSFPSTSSPVSSSSFIVSSSSISSSEISSSISSSSFSSSLSSSSISSSSSTSSSFSSSSLTSSSIASSSSSEFSSSSFIPSSTSFSSSSSFLPSSTSEFTSTSSTSSSTSSSSSSSTSSSSSSSSETTSSTTSKSSSTTPSSITSSFSAYTSTLVSDHSTRTTVVTAEATPATVSASSNNSNRNAKVIGGVVGAVGGTIAIAAILLFFLFYKRKKNNTFVNQSPDFNDDTGSSAPANKGGSFGFKKIFGSKVPAAQIGGLAAYNDIEHQLNTKTESEKFDGESHSDDFVYRGVTNNNNLDSVFNRTSPTNTSGQNTNSATARHSRFNSYGGVAGIPVGGTETPSTNTTAAPPYPTSQEFVFQNHPTDEDHQQFPLMNSGNPNTNATGRTRGHARMDSNEFDPSDYDIEEDHLVPADRHEIFANNELKNSRSRFTEEII